MARTRHEFEELRHRVHEIGHLRQKEKQKWLGKMPMNAHYRKSHAREIAKRVTNEDFGRVPEDVDQNNRNRRRIYIISRIRWTRKKNRRQDGANKGKFVKMYTDERNQ